MQKINNYITEKLHIGKDFNSKPFKSGSDVGFEKKIYTLVDSIDGNSPIEDIIEFIKKYDSIEKWNRWGNFSDDLSEYTSEYKKSCDLYKYIIAIADKDGKTSAWWYNRENFRIYENH